MRCYKLEKFKNQVSLLPYKMDKPAYSGLIIDLKGPVYNEMQEGDLTHKIITTGSKEFIDFLVGEKIPHIFATNVTSETRDDIVENLKNIGLDIPSEKIMTCIDTCMGYLKRENLENIYLISGNEKLRKIFDDEFNLIGGYEPDGEVPHAVVVGYDKGFNARVMNDAVAFVLYGARLVALHMNSRRMTLDGRVECNVGAYIACIARGAEIDETEIVVVGKPNREFYRQAFSRLNMKVNTSKILVIGDDPEADLRGGRNFGMSTAFFPTNKYPEWPGHMEFQPDITITETLEELIPYFSKMEQ